MATSGAGTSSPGLVSVVVPTFNSGAMLEACLRSVREQAGDFALEIVVVDDASTDDGLAWLRTQHDVALVALPHNRGPAAARNAGLAVARGELVAFLDADDLWPAGKLQAQVDLLRRYPDAAMVFGDCVQFDEGGPRPLSEFVASGLLTGLPALAAEGGPLPQAYLRLLQGAVVTTGSVLARRDPLLALGGFAEDLRWVEDLELWLRVAREHAVLLCTRTCLLRRRHAGNLSRDTRAMASGWAEVLRRQPAPADAATAAVLARLRAEAHLQLAAHALAQRDLGAATAEALRGLRERPALRDLAAALRDAGRTWRQEARSVKGRRATSARGPERPL